MKPLAEYLMENNCLLDPPEQLDVVSGERVCVTVIAPKRNGFIMKCIWLKLDDGDWYVE